MSDAVSRDARPPAAEMLSDYADLLDMLLDELRVSKDHQYHRGFTVNEIRAEATRMAAAGAPAQHSAATVNAINVAMFRFRHLHGLRVEGEPKPLDFSAEMRLMATALASKTAAAGAPAARPLGARQEFEWAFGHGLRIQDLSDECLLTIRNAVDFDTTADSALVAREAKAGAPAVRPGRTCGFDPVAELEFLKDVEAAAVRPEPQQDEK